MRPGRLVTARKSTATTTDRQMRDECCWSFITLLQVDDRKIGVVLISALLGLPERGDGS